MRTVLILLLLLLCSPAYAVNLICALPNSAVARAQELCEVLRKELRVRVSEWSNNTCATQMLFLGLRQANRIDSRRTADQAGAVTTSTAINTFEPLIPNPTPALCGDGTLDTEFGEACDDGNRVDGDLCDSSCQIEAL